MKFLDFIIKSFRYTRRTHNINDLDEFVDRCSPEAATGKLVASPSRRVILDSREAFIKARTLTKIPSILQPGAAVKQIRSRSQGVRHTKHFELMISPKICDSLSRRVFPFKKRASEFSVYERRLLSCANTTSMCSYKPEKHSISTGLLRCEWKNGLPLFGFFVDDLRERYVANPVKVKCSVDKALDYIYLFHSGAYGGKDFRNSAGNTSRFVGKMKVSTSLVLNLDKPNFMETEFVLFGSNDDYSNEMQSSSSLKRKGLAKKVAEMLKPSCSPKRKYGHRAAKSCSQFDGLHEIIEDVLNTTNEDPADLLSEDFPTNYELAAIVVKDYKLNSHKESVNGGWGLKFLKPSSASENCEESCAQTTGKSAQHVHVAVPAGFHGGPLGRIGGPSSLTERWKAGGQCSCGGWDVGCPITVLNGKISCSDALTKVELQDSKSVDLFAEGPKHGEPVLRLCNVSEDVYLIHFQPTVSALQCFSVGVALVHARAPNLYPQL